MHSSFPAIFRSHQSFLISSWFANMNRIYILMVASTLSTVQQYQWTPQMLIYVLPLMLFAYILWVRQKKVWQRRPFSWSGNEACCFRCGGWGALLSGLVILCEQNNGAIVIFLSFPPLDFPDLCIIFHSLWRGANLFGRILLSPPPPANCMGTQSFKAVQSHLGGYMYVGLHMHTDDSYSALSTWANMRNEKWSYRKFENAPCRKQRESWCVIVVIFFNLLFYLVHLW